MSAQEKVADWLRGEGYPLEMRVAAAMRAEGTHIAQSWHFEDQQTGKSRELDVLSIGGDIAGIAAVYLCVECKATSKPWVLLRSPEGLVPFNRLFGFGVSSSEVREAMLEKLERFLGIPWFRKAGPISYGITEAFTNSNDKTHGAVLGAIKACVSLVYGESPRNSRLTVAFPVVVTSSKLFECHLDAKGEMRLTEVKEGWLYVSEAFPGFSGTCVRIVSESGLEALCTEVAETRSAVLLELQDAIESAWKDLTGQQSYPLGSDGAT